jgi:hypothetical protein
MSEETGIDIPEFAVLRASSIDVIPAKSAEEAHDLAVHHATLNNVGYLAVRVLGQALRPIAPVQWTPLTGAENVTASSPFIPLPPQTVTTPTADSTPPWEAPPAALVKPQPTKVVPPTPVAPAIDNSVKVARAAPRYPNIRGVVLPPYCDIAATEGPDGPPTKEQYAAAEAEITRMGKPKDSLSKTVKSWTGLEVNAVNSATMEAVVKILQAWGKE